MKKHANSTPKNTVLKCIRMPVMLFLTPLAANCSLAAEAPEWQTASTAFSPRPSKIMDQGPFENVIPTPGFIVLNNRNAQPRLGLMGFPGMLNGASRVLPSIVSIGINSEAAPYYCDFGEIRQPDLPDALKLADTTGDWSFVLFEYTSAGRSNPDLSLLASRASPAMLVRSSLDKLSLFADRRVPVPKPGHAHFPVAPDWRAGAAPMLLALPQGDGVALKKPPAAGDSGSSEITVDPERGTWLLCWFGKGSGFHANNFPYDYSGKTHGYMVQNLLWQGKPVAGEGDCPVLLLFDEPPWSVFAGGDGLEITFDTSEKKEHAVALLPLYGNRFIPAAETEKWREKLPDDVLAQCRWWDAHLGAFPGSVTETYKYNDEDGSVTITENVEFIPFRENGARLAPMPPMAALALTQGFPLKLAANGRECQWSQSSVATIHGPYGGVPDTANFSWTVPGMGRLVKERPVAGPAVTEDARLVRQLEDQIRRMIEAGHMAPWYCSQNSWSAGYRGYLMRADRFVWSNPAETLHVLAQALPFLDTEIQAGVLKYMKEEREQFPPERIAHTPVMEGAQREWHRHSEDDKTYMEHQQLVNAQNFYLNNNIIPEESLYFMADYFAAAGGGEVNKNDIQELVGHVLAPYLARQDLGTLGFWPPSKPWAGWFAGLDGQGGVADANRHLTALIGALRLKLLAGDSEGIEEFWGLLARAAVWRFALGKFGQHLYANGFMTSPAQPDWQAEWWESSNIGRMITWNWTGPGDDIRQVLMQAPHMVQFDELRNTYNGGAICVFAGASPELGRFAAEYLKPELKTFSDRYEMTVPSWFIAKATTEYGAEFNYTPPEDPWQVFMIRAWVLGESGPQLEKYLDIPWVARGDLYYILKLVETIKAYRGVKWE